MKNYLAFLLACSLLVSVSCNRTNLSKSTNCPFEENDNDDGIIDSEEEEIMDACFENVITSASELRAAVIGSWELVGHGEGWFVSRPQPCSRIEITEDELTLEFKNAHIDTITYHTWEVIDDPSRSYLSVTPSLGQGVFLSVVCDEYMYGNATFVDGNMYIYKRD